MTSNKKKTTKAVKPPKVDPAFEKLIMPLSTDELAQLEQNLLAVGRCRDKLIVWKGKNILLDGHHRFKICKTYDLKYEVVEMAFDDREDAIAFIRKNQLGRRNMPPEAMSYIRGQHYNSEKESHGGKREAGSSGKDCHLKTDEALAERYKVAAKTIRNDADFAKDLDAIEKAGGEDLKTALLRREVRLTRSQVKALAAMKPASINKTVKSVLDSGKMPSRKTTADDPDSANTGTITTKMEKITVPTSPLGLAKTLLLRLGPSGVAEVQWALETVLADHQAKHQSGKSEDVVQPSPEVVDKVE